MIAHPVCCSIAGDTPACVKVSLRTLDISQNRIMHLENLACLPLLETLNVSKNALETAESIAELTLCPRLSSVDFSHNNLTGDGIIETISKIPNLLSMRVTGNPAVSTPQFRKKVLAAIPRLAYMDRPIFAGERVAAEAWKEGGPAAEKEAREAHRASLREKELNERQSYRKWVADKRQEAAERRAAKKESKVEHPIETAVGQSEGSAGAGPKEIIDSFWATNPNTVTSTGGHESGGTQNVCGVRRKEVSDFRAPAVDVDGNEIGKKDEFQEVAVKAPHPPLRSVEIPGLSMPPLPPSQVEEVTTLKTPEKIPTPVSSSSLQESGSLEVIDDVTDFDLLD